MAQTQSTLITHVLQDLGALAAGSTASAEDIAAVSERLLQIYADLAGRRIYTVADPNAIADSAYPELLRLVVEALAPTFGRPANAEVIAAAEAALLLIDRRAATATTLVREVLDRLDAVGKLSPALNGTVITARVAEVLASLSARRVITFANEAAITAAARPHIAVLVADACVQGAFAAPQLEAAEAQLIALSRRDRAADDFTTQVLDILALWGAGGSVVDATSIEATIQGVLDDLALRQVIYIADIASASAAAKLYVARLVAAQFTPEPAIAIITEAERKLQEQDRAGRVTPRTRFSRDLIFQRDRRGSYNGS